MTHTNKGLDLAVRIFILLSLLSTGTIITGADVKLTPCMKLLSAGKTAEGIKTCTREINKSPKNSMLYLFRGMAYADQKKPVDAMTDFNTSIQINSALAPAYTARCTLKRLQDDFRGALADCTEALKLGDPSGSPYAERGFAKIGLKDYIGAIADFEQAIKIDPESGLAYAGRGTARIELKEKEAGCLDLSKAGELGMTTAYEAIRNHCN